MSETHPLSPESPDDTFYVVDSPSIADGFPLFGRWVPRESFIPNWAATEFLNGFFSERYDIPLAAHASNIRNGEKCTVDQSSFNAGGQHLVMHIRFEDDVTWLARIRFPPCTRDGHRCVGGFRTFRNAALSMESEIATIMYVKKNTSLPVPRVYGYDLGRDNCVSAPYMLIEEISGTNVEERIFRDGGIYGVQMKSVDRQVREFIAELATLRFNKIGRLCLDKENEMISFPGAGGPFASSGDYYLVSLQTKISTHGYHRVVDESYRPSVVNWDAASESEIIEIAFWIYLQIAKFLGSQSSEGPFPLEHPDWNDQNIMVDEDYRVVGVIDWENARTCPVESFRSFSSKLFKHDVKGYTPPSEVDEISQLNQRSRPVQEDGIKGRDNTDSVSVSGRLCQLAHLFEQPYFPQQFVEQVPRIVRFVYDHFPADNEKIVPLDIAKILGI
jgi:Phosphotransferase enzyme family